MRSSLAAGVCLGVVLLLAGCGATGPVETPVVAENTDFHTLFARNCAGCHGDNGMRGPAPRLNDPVYLAIADRDVIYKTIEYGRPGTTMPPLGRAQGGTLSDNQVNAIVNGMEHEWAVKVDLGNYPVPAYSVDNAPPGDAQRGRLAYQKNCMMCHGFGKFKGKAGAILDPHYLALVSDQGLRSTMIVGRPDWGMPDWRHRIPGRPTSDQDMSDIVAWLASQRPKYAVQVK